MTVATVQEGFELTRGMKIALITSALFHVLVMIGGTVGLPIHIQTANVAAATNRC